MLGGHYIGQPYLGEAYDDDDVPDLQPAHHGGGRHAPALPEDAIEPLEADGRIDLLLEEDAQAYTERNASLEEDFARELSETLNPYRRAI